LAARDVTVEGGRHQLQTLASTEMKVEEGYSCLPLATPGAACDAMLKVLDIQQQPIPGARRK